VPEARLDLLASVLPLAKALRRIEDEAAAGHDLTMWQYAVLQVVAAGPGRNQAEVAARLDYSRNRIVADLDALEERGLLVRRAGADRRANELVITDDGTATMGAVQAAIHRAEDALLAPLSSQDRKALHRLLPKLAASARSSRPPPKAD